MLLLGEASSRPEGLERALARAGFAVAEGGAELSESDPPAAVLVTAEHADDVLAGILATVDCAYGRATPRIAVLTSADRDGPARALALGADDAVAAPVHLGELAARVGLRMRDRAGRSDLAGGELHAAMLELVGDVHTSIRSEEILRTLVERVGRALNLANCSFVLTPSGADHGRVLAQYGEPTTRDVRLDLSRYPEITEAVHTGRTVVIADVHSDPLFKTVRRRWNEQSLTVAVQSVVALPMRVAGDVTGVLLLRTRDAGVQLLPAQIGFAETLSTAAARVLELTAKGGAFGRRDASVDPVTGCGTPDALDGRIREEFERARRYALSFSLVLLDIDELRADGERKAPEIAERMLAEIGGVLRTGLRVPDYICRYGADEFAVLLPETALAGARQSVNRVRQRLGAHAFADVASGAVPRFSAGIVTFPHPAAEQVGDLFALAEAALLRGKSQSGDRTGTAEAVAT